MTRRLLLLASWVSLAGFAIAAFAAAFVLALGVLVTTGKTSLPSETSVGPFSFGYQISTPVAAGGEICQKAIIGETDSGKECVALFLHPPNWEGGGDKFRAQDAGVRPQQFAMRGPAALAYDGGWNSFVAGQFALDVTALLLASLFFGLLWRLLRTSSEAPGHLRRRIQNLGLVLIGLGVLQAAGGQLGNVMKWGYSAESFGPGLHLSPSSTGGMDITTLCFGVLLVLIGSLVGSDRSPALPADHSGRAPAAEGSPDVT